ncbi:gamma-glutamylcyclotransferase [Methanobrevibacter sp.]|uniref:gamma-glutamylcyclotransferase family protein n=1 Tax=Methanobrevibacter sp. TaxID=66852 RepID=UPI00388E79AD
MNMIKLEKISHKKPEFDELYKMLSDLKDFLNEDADPNDKDYLKNLDAILEFQDNDGSFKLFDSFNVPIDAMVDFCYMPTYLCSAILMKAYMSFGKDFSLKQKLGLLNGLKMSCAKNLVGHGFEGLKQQIEAINIFMKAGVKEYLDLNHDFCYEFGIMMDGIIKDYHKKEAEGKFNGYWGESYEEDIKAINEYFCQRLVFVYGTLMKGKPNHHYLENSSYLGKASIEGYDMYDVGWYPAIVQGSRQIPGELYQVPAEDMPSIDMLEGEGSLYKKRCETVMCADGKTRSAFVYVYLRDVSDLTRIPAWNEYIWYVSYGSNMLFERFMCYIKGGSYRGSTYRDACSDTASPAEVRAFEIPYDMYFGNTSGSWQSCGVSFLDTTKDGHALGVAYLITKEQFEHVIAEENGGRTPTPGYGWYEDVISLGEIEGIEVKTVTNNNLRPYNDPCLDYLDTLVKGIRENWPEMSDDEIEDYLKSCIRK